jgi:hypothetical protein
VIRKKAEEGELKSDGRQARTQFIYWVLPLIQVVHLIEPSGSQFMPADMAGYTIFGAFTFVISNRSLCGTQR